MPDKNETFQAVSALLSLQEEGEKVYNLRDFQFSDKSRNIPVCLASHHSGTEGINDCGQFERSSKPSLKATVYMELAKSSMRKGKLELRDLKDTLVIHIIKSKASPLILIFIFGKKT